MVTALRDMPTWRRSLIEHGLTTVWLARETGRSVQTVRSYSTGRRTPPADWLAAADAAIRAAAKGEAA